MLRTAVIMRSKSKKPKAKFSFTFKDVRQWTKREQDEKHFDRLIDLKLITIVSVEREYSEDRYELTEIGEQASELGFYEWEPKVASLGLVDNTHVD